MRVTTDFRLTCYIISVLLFKYISLLRLILSLVVSALQMKCFNMHFA